jgi:hypothetical protein
MLAIRHEVYNQRDTTSLIRMSWHGEHEELANRQ